MLEIIKITGGIVSNKEQIMDMLPFRFDEGFLYELQQASKDLCLSPIDVLRNSVVGIMDKVGKIVQKIEADGYSVHSSQRREIFFSLVVTDFVDWESPQVETLIRKIKNQPMRLDPSKVVSIDDYTEKRKTQSPLEPGPHKKD
jgi:hypothetical protein